MVCKSFRIVDCRFDPNSRECNMFNTFLSDGIDVKVIMELSYSAYRYMNAMWDGIRQIQMDGRSKSFDKKLNLIEVIGSSWKLSICGTYVIAFCDLHGS